MASVFWLCIRVSRITCFVFACSETVYPCILYYGYVYAFCAYIARCVLTNSCCLYLCLNHKNALCSELLEKLKDVEIVFLLHSLQHAIQYDKCSRPPHSRTAVHQEGARVRVRVDGANTPDEIYEHDSILWYPVVRPASEMELSHLVRGTVWGSKLCTRQSVQVQ